MIKAIIFDMDGLMIDSERVTFEGYEQILEKRKLTIDIEFYKSLLGTPTKSIFNRFYEVYGEDFPIEEIIKEVHAYMANLFETKGVPLKKGLVELLQYVKEKGYKTMIATSSNRDRVNTIVKLADIEQYFDDSICGDEVSVGKPNPEVFIRACEKLGVKPEEAIVLEDSEAGIEASYQAKVPVICIPDMKYPGDEYTNKTVAILEDLSKVINYLEQ